MKPKLGSPLCLLASALLAWPLLAAAAQESTPVHPAAPVPPLVTERYDLELGKQTFTGKCLACHGDALSGAPQYGEQEDWRERIAQGRDTLIKHALNGHGRMPPKGGLESLSDDEVRAAVAFVYDRSQRMLANQRLERTSCIEGGSDPACETRDSEEAVILHMLWLLTGGGTAGGK